MGGEVIGGWVGSVGDGGRISVEWGWGQLEMGPDGGGVSGDGVGSVGNGAGDGGRGRCVSVLECCVDMDDRVSD